MMMLAAAVFQRWLFSDIMMMMLMAPVFQRWRQCLRVTDNDVGGGGVATTPVSLSVTHDDVNDIISCYR
jgi:hypothetical protein